MATIERYTHGHHESVLREPQLAHGRELAPPTCVPHLRAGRVGARRRDAGPERSRSTSPRGRAGVASSASTRRPRTSVTRRRARAERSGLTNVEFVAATCTSCPSTTTRSTSCTRTRCCSTSPTRSRALREMRRVAEARRSGRGPRRHYRGAVWAPSPAGPAPMDGRVPAVHRGNGGEPDAGSSLKAWALEAGFEDIVDGRVHLVLRLGRRRARVVGRQLGRARHSSRRSAPHVDRGAARPTLDDLHAISEAWKTWRGRRARLVRDASRRDPRDEVIGPRWHRAGTAIGAAIEVAALARSLGAQEGSLESALVVLIVGAADVVDSGPSADAGW